MKYGYVDGQYGQIHYLSNQGASSAPTLYCLHATAYSSRSFESLLRALQPTVKAVALDTPGYGSSSHPTYPLLFSQYSDALAASIEKIADADSGLINLFGYHTGAMLAVDIAARYPQLVGKLMLAGVPFFQGDERNIWRDKLVADSVLTEDLEQFRARWNYFIAGRTNGLTLEHSFQCFVDELRSYPNEARVHKALFDFEPAERLKAVRASTLVIDFPSALSAQSQRAAALISHSVIRPSAELGAAPLQLSPERLAAIVTDFLSDNMP